MSTDNVDRLVTALDWQPEDMDRARRAHRRNILMLLILCLAMIGWTVAQEVNNIVEARRTGDWYLALGVHFAGQIAEPILFLSFLYSMIRYAPQIRQPQIEAALLALRAAAAHGHEEVAPHAAKVMHELAQEEIPNLPVQIRSLQHPGRHAVSSVAMLVHILLDLGIITLLGSVGILLFYSTRTDDLWMIVGIPGLLFTATGIILLGWMRRRKCGITVTADETGLHWTPLDWRKNTRSLRWEHSRAFYVVGHLNDDAQQQWAVTLDAPGVLLSWDVAPTFKPESIAASDRLGALILARTGLPLRDLTATAQKLMIEPWNRHHTQTQEALRTLIPEVETHYAAIPPTTWWREAWPAAFIMSLAVVVTALLYGVALLAQHVSP